MRRLNQLGRSTTLRIQQRAEYEGLCQGVGGAMAAASRVVNDVANVSSETRDKVLSAVSHLQYSPNVHAAKLARTNGGIP
jgi:hypothetical protein